MKPKEIKCSIREIETESHDGILAHATVLRCEHCGHEIMSFGTGRGPLKRCIKLMADECPLKEDNIYFIDDDE